jgi:hypothetical protein
MSTPENKKSIISSDEAIAFVYQESPNSDPVFKIRTGRIEDSAESLPELVRIIRSIRNGLRFLTRDEIDERFGPESPLMRPFTAEEKKKLNISIS